MAREWNQTDVSAFLTGSLGHAYALLEQTAEGLPMLEHALSAMETTGFRLLQPLFLTYLGEAYVLANRLEDARAFTGRALTEAWALRLLGEIAAHRDPPDDAEGHYREALALAEELGMRPLVAHCHLGLGKLYRSTDTREQAQEHLTTATTMYREMSTPFWLEHVEAETKDLA